MNSDTISCKDLYFDSRYHIDDINEYRNDLMVFCCSYIDRSMNIGTATPLFACGDVTYCIKVSKPDSWTMGYGYNRINDYFRDSWMDQVNNHYLHYLDIMPKKSDTDTSSPVRFEMSRDEYYGMIIPGKEYDVGTIKALSHNLGLFCSDEIDSCMEVNCVEITKGVHVIIVRRPLVWSGLPQRR